jgi:hypothetical protein
MAYNRGHSVLVWLILGLLGGGLTLLVAARLPNRTQQRVMQELVRACPHCLGLVPITSRVCHFCQRTLWVVTIGMLEQEQCTSMSDVVRHEKPRQGATWRGEIDRGGAAR